MLTSSGIRIVIMMRFSRLSSANFTRQALQLATFDRGNGQTANFTPRLFLFALIPAPTLAIRANLWTPLDALLPLMTASLALVKGDFLCVCNHALRYT